MSSPGWRRIIVAGLVAAACGTESGTTLSAAASTGGDVPKVFEVEKMVGVPVAYTGTKSPIRGVNGGGLPWVINKGEAKLTADGRLKVEVEGLVLDPNDPTVISRGLAGQNPIPAFRAILSCQTVTDGAASIANVATGSFPATTDGNATIDEVISIPSPCIAPIVFVTNPGLAWFAASGF